MAIIHKSIQHLHKPEGLVEVDYPGLHSVYFFTEAAGGANEAVRGISGDSPPSDFTWEINNEQGRVIRKSAVNDNSLILPVMPPTGGAIRSLLIRYKPDANALSSDKVIVEYGDTPNGERWTLRLVNGVLRFEIQSAGQTTSLGLTADQWHDIGVSQSGNTFGNVVLFMDGQSEAMSGTNTINTVGTNKPNVMGEFKGSIHAGATGDIAYIAWLDRSHSQTEFDELRSNPLVLLKPRRRWVPFSGAAGTTFNQAVSGSITSTGAVTFITSFVQTLAGSISSTGTLTRKISTSVEGSITSTGSVLKKTIRDLAGSITSTGTLASVLSSDILKTVTGSITATGALTKKVFRSLSGSVSSTGDITKKTSTDLDGSIGMSGDPDKGMAQDTSGSITPTGDLTASAPFVPAPDEGGGPGPDGSLAQRIRRVYGKFKRSSFR